MLLGERGGGGGEPGGSEEKADGVTGGEREAHHHPAPSQHLHPQSPSTFGGSSERVFLRK